MSDNEEFCTNCGARVNHSDNNEPIINKEALKSAADRLKSRSENAMAHLKDSASNFIPDMGVSGNNNEAGIQSVFVDPNEQLIAKLGNDYLVNLLYSKIKTCNVLLSDRRVYLKGVFYNGNVKSFTKTTEEKILDIEDVTGTGFIYSRHFGYYVSVFAKECNRDIFLK